MRYPHLLKYERKIWKRYLQKYPCQYDSVTYDVHVGRGKGLSVISDPEALKMWEHLIKKRIDVIAEKNDVLYLFEVKRNASHQAIGQVLCYNKLYRRDYSYSGKISMYIITDYALPDVEFLCHCFDISIVEV